MKLKFNMLTHLTHINTIFEYYHASIVLGNEDVLYLEDGNVYRLVLKNKTTTFFLLKNLFLVLRVEMLLGRVKRLVGAGHPCPGLCPRGPCHRQATRSS